MLKLRDTMYDDSICHCMRERYLLKYWFSYLHLKDLIKSIAERSVELRKVDLWRKIVPDFNTCSSIVPL